MRGVYRGSRNAQLLEMDVGEELIDYLDEPEKAHDVARRWVGAGKSRMPIELQGRRYTARRAMLIYCGEWPVSPRHVLIIRREL